MSCAHQSQTVAYAFQGLAGALAAFSRWLSFRLRSDFKQNSSVSSLRAVSQVAV